jgi:UDP-glucose:(heptosyl)LPS alpha-1,3-glucosyltransferase
MHKIRAFICVHRSSSVAINLLVAGLVECDGSQYSYSVKIALVILHADVARGGAERYTLDLAASLAKRGHNVSILASSFQTEKTAGRRVLLTASGITRTGRYLKFLDSLDDELNQSGYEVVHAMLPVRRCDIYHPHAGIAAEAVAEGHLNKAGAIQKVLSRIGNLFNARRNKFAQVERGLLTKSNPPVVLCLSNLIKGVVKKYYPGLPDDKLVSLFNGIDLAKFDPATQPESRLEIRDRFSITHDEVVGLMLAQDFERKGLRQAIEAVAKVPGLILLVGGRPDPSPYRQLAKSLGVSDRVIFAGQATDPVAFYLAADFFVLPTRFDPCSLVLLEALAMGLPVISTVKNGACEIMQNGVHGFVLEDPDDISALADAVNVVAAKNQRAKMSDSCLALRQHLSQDAHLDRLEAVYHVLVKNRTDAFGDLAQR